MNDCYKYPFNEICTTFPSVSFVVLKWEIVCFPYQYPFMGSCIYGSATVQATIDTSNILPKEFVAKEYVNLVYDSIVLVHQQLKSADQLSLIKKKQRTVKMPTSDLD